MTEYLLLMHGDAIAEGCNDMWREYFARLHMLDAFLGGSAIGAGEAYRKEGVPGAMAAHITGFIRIRAQDMAEARAMLIGNPVYECGGTVEIRQLPED